MSRGANKQTKRARRSEALARLAPMLVARARSLQSMGWDGRLSSYVSPAMREHAWAEATAAMLAALS